MQVQAALEQGDDCQELAATLVATGYTPTPELLLASFGDRHLSTSASPKTLRVLLEARADPNGLDPRTGVALLHTACWFGTPKLVSLMIDFNADIEVKENVFSNMPPLNTALAAGNSKVCLELLRRHANVQWSHYDGATALHVATAWLVSSTNHQMRVPPMGDEPVFVIRMMLHNGVDPLKTEANGVTPLVGFRTSFSRSPWRTHAVFGSKFDQMAQHVDRVLEQAVIALNAKQTGNMAFKEELYQDALKHYAESRCIWEAIEVHGHHLAVLWSNEAQCWIKLKQWDHAKSACEEGLGHYCTPPIKAKLETRLQEATEGIVQERKAMEKLATSNVKRGMRWKRIGRWCCAG